MIHKTTGFRLLYIVRDNIKDKTKKIKTDESIKITTSPKTDFELKGSLKMGLRSKNFFEDTSQSQMGKI